MLFKKTLKILNKLYFFEKPQLSKIDKKNYDYIFYLKEPISHIIAKKILNSGLENCLMIIDDQYGFKSKTDEYEGFIRLKTKFSLQNFFRLWKNEFSLLDEMIINYENIMKDRCFIPIYDRSQEMEYFIPKYKNIFSKTITIQHGSLGTPGKYFPFLSDIFIARSHADAKIGIRYGLKNDQCLIIGGNITSSYISNDQLISHLKNGFKNSNILYATGFGLRSNIKFLISGIRTATSSIQIYFKPHPSDRLKMVYEIIIFFANLLGKNINIIEKISSKKYKFLVTESSSLIFELLREGTMPVIFNPDNKILPEYIEFWIYNTTTPKIDFEEAQKFYQDKIDLLKDYYYRNNYQNIHFDSVEMLYRKILEELKKYGSIRSKELIEMYCEN